jgi:hypothetical protein
MPKYIVKEPLLHDQKEIAPGKTVEMETEQAAALLLVNAIAAVPEKAAK